MGDTESLKKNIRRRIYQGRLQNGKNFVHEQN